MAEDDVQSRLNTLQETFPDTSLELIDIISKFENDMFAREFIGLVCDINTRYISDEMTSIFMNEILTNIDILVNNKLSLWRLMLLTKVFFIYKAPDSYSEDDIDDDITNEIIPNLDKRIDELIDLMDNLDINFIEERGVMVQKNRMLKDFPIDKLRQVLMGREYN